MCHDFPVGGHPNHGIGIVIRFRINDHALGRMIVRFLFCRVDNIRKFGNADFQRRVKFDGIFPLLISVGCQVHVVFAFVIVKDSGFLVIKVFNVNRVTFKEHFIGSDGFRVFLDPLLQTAAKIDDAFNSVFRQEGITENVFGNLSDTVDASGPLDQSDNGPRQIVVDDDMRILKILSFADHVRGNYNTDFFTRFEF